VTRTLKAQTEEVEKRGKERLEDEIRRHEREVRDLRDRDGSERNSLERRIDEGEREVRKLKGDIENLRADLEREQTMNRQLKVRHLTATNSTSSSL
jgi:predicted RNase H-like nuclease (RuvC/YqgF family)